MNRMTSLRLGLTCCWMLLALVTGYGQTGGQPKDEALRIEATLVNVPVIVSDPGGRFIPGLKQGDFTLFENGVRQNIDAFDAAEAPLNVALLIDTSASTTLVLDNIKDAAKRFLRELRPQDRATVIAFDNDVRELCPLTGDRKQLERAVDAAQIGNDWGTLLNDAVAFVIKNRFRNVTGRKAIILLTDGDDHGSIVTTEQMLDTATESEALIYPIFYHFDFDQIGGLLGRLGERRGGPRAQRRRERQKEREQYAADLMRQLADASAGRFFKSDSTNLGKAFKAIAEELRSQYQLGFYPENLATDGIERKLRVQVGKSGVVVRARKSYRLTAKN
jgi:Ca-activated chloride channel homolog